MGDCSSHSFRHLAAQWARRSGADIVIRNIARWVGYSNLFLYIAEAEKISVTNIATTRVEIPCGIFGCSTQIPNMTRWTREHNKINTINLTLDNYLLLSMLIFPVRPSIQPSVRPSVSDHVDCKRACHAWFLHQWNRLRQALTLTSLLLPQSLDYLAIT
jgi:hypothetical protein